MNIYEAQEILLANIRAQMNGLPSAAMLWGPPGVGKSSIVHQAAQQLGLQVTDIRLSTLSAVDVRGLPYIDKEQGVTRFSRPYFVPEKEGHLLFFDEVNTAPPANQVVAYEIALDRKVGGHPLPKGTIVIMAGNRASDRGATHAMPVPLANRLQHITVEPNIDATFNYGVAKDWNSDVLAFLKFRPALLFVPPKGDQQAFPSPRTWEFVSQMLAYNDSLAAIAGFVGEGAASEFLAFRRLAKELPDLDQVLKDGTPFKHPELSVMYAYVVGLTQKLMSVAKLTNTTIKNFLNAIQAVPTELKPLILRTLQAKPEVAAKLMGTPEFAAMLKEIAAKAR